MFHRKDFPTINKVQKLQVAVAIIQIITSNT